MSLAVPTLKVRLTESRSDIPLTRELWNALADRSTASTVFQTWEWFDAWWSSFGAGHHLYFLSVHDGADVVGFAPLMMIRGRLRVRQLEFVGSPNADYQDFVDPDRRSETSSAICRFLHAERRNWDMLVLRNLPADSPTRMELITGFAQLGLGSMDTELIPCPSLCIAGHDSEVQDLIRRYSVTRKVRQLEQRGKVTYRVLDTAEEVQHCLPSFFEQHMQRRATGQVAEPIPRCQAPRVVSSHGREHGPGGLAAFFEDRVRRETGRVSLWVLFQRRPELVQAQLRPSIRRPIPRHGADPVPDRGRMQPETARTRFFRG